jgi:hypothetical protein
MAAYVTLTCVEREQDASRSCYTVLALVAMAWHCPASSSAVAVVYLCQPLLLCQHELSANENTTNRLPVYLLLKWVAPLA